MKCVRQDGSRQKKPALGRSKQYEEVAFIEVEQSGET